MSPNMNLPAKRRGVLGRFCQDELEISLSDICSDQAVGMVMEANRREISASGIPFKNHLHSRSFAVERSNSILRERWFGCEEGDGFIAPPSAQQKGPRPLATLFVFCHELCRNRGPLPLTRANLWGNHISVMSPNHGTARATSGKVEKPATDGLADGGGQAADV
jgi:hypothetical protein